LIQAGTGLTTRDPADIVSADHKLYEAGGLNFGIAQAEVTSLVELDEYREKLKDALIQLRDSKGLDFAILMVTDVVRGSSRLLLTSDVPALEGLPYPRLPDGTLRAPGVVSRKKQLLPTVLGALEG
jgi:manganese-dependent inorganic pyrophosphatase